MLFTLADTFNWEALRDREMKDSTIMIAFERGYYSTFGIATGASSTINPYVNEGMRLAFENGKREGLRKSPKSVAELALAHVASI